MASISTRRRRGRWIYNSSEAKHGNIFCHLQAITLSVPLFIPCTFRDPRLVYFSGFGTTFDSTLNMYRLWVKTMTTTATTRTFHVYLSGVSWRLKIFSLQVAVKGEKRFRYTPTSGGWTQFWLICIANPLAEMETVRCRPSECATNCATKKARAASRIGEKCTLSVCVFNFIFKLSHRWFHFSFGFDKHWTRQPNSRPLSLVLIMFLFVIP